MSTTIRRNEDGSVDEILATGRVHVEQMDDASWWVGIETDEGRLAFTFGLSPIGEHILLTLTEEPGVSEL